MLEPGEIIVVHDMCFQIKEVRSGVVVDDYECTLVVAECLELDTGAPRWWHFPFTDKRYLQNFADDTRRVLN